MGLFPSVLGGIALICDAAVSVDTVSDVMGEVEEAMEQHRAVSEEMSA